eukprot:213003-Chlamydomonas_euryale.AAC.1
MEHNSVRLGAKPQPARPPLQPRFSFFFLSPPHSVPPDPIPVQVEHNSMDQYGSCFDIHVFDPHGLPKEDSLQRLHAQWDREGDRKKAARAAMPAEQLRAGVRFVGRAR